MTDLQLIETFPGAENFSVFTSVPRHVYGDTWSVSMPLHTAPEKDLVACYYVLKNGVACGRMAVYNNPDLFWNGEKALCIGAYECVSDPAVSALLLQQVEHIARAQHCPWIIGPMSGSTWKSYRFSLHWHSPPFLTEPYHQMYYNQQFLNAGYSVIAEYFSALDEQMQVDPLRMEESRIHFERSGVRIRTFDISNPGKELYRIGNFCIETFKNNLFYTPITVEEFVADYMPYVTLFEPKCILLVEDVQGELHALFFAIPDVMDTHHKTLVVKSIARKKNSPFRGISLYASQLVYSEAKKMGYTRAIHAFMHVDNVSGKLSAALSDNRYKQYALYGKRIS